MGRAVITADAPGCRETVRAGETGLLVPAQNSAATAEAMRMLAGDAEMRQSMGDAGRRFCEEKYAVDKTNVVMLGHLGLSA